MQIAGVKPLCDGIIWPHLRGT